MTTFTLLDASDGPLTPRAFDAEIADGSVGLDPAEVTDHLGWTLKDEGLCRGEVCIPVRDRANLVRGQRLDLASLAALLSRPLALDAEEGLAVLGESAETRAAQLATLEAPEFSLPDLAGVPHGLAEHRGNKVLLIAYASW